MAKRRRRSKKKSGVSPVVSMLFGLAVGLSVAAAVYMKDRRPDSDVGAASAANPTPASLQDALDDNGESSAVGGSSRPIAAEAAPAEEKEEKRFTFYDILPNFEVVTGEVDEPVAESATVEPQAIVEPGVYLLQAGSFSTYNDADRRRAALALHGIESRINRVTIDGKNYHRVIIGPTDDLDELNMLRSRLRAAQIDVLRIRYDK